jgi:hypothetical protein
MHAVPRSRTLFVAALVSGLVFVGALGVAKLWPRHAQPPVRAWVTGTAIHVDTAQSSRVYLEYGPTRRYGLFSAASGAGLTHRFRLVGLSPGTRYHVRAMARTGGSVLAAPDLVLDVAAGPAFHSLRTVGDHFELDGRPWIPRFTWGSCASSYAEEAAAGVNAFMSSNCGDSAERQARAAQRVGGVVIPALDQANLALPTTVAAHYKDEPDVTQIPPAQLAGDWNAHPNAHGIPTFLTLSHLAASDDPGAVTAAAAYARLTDVLGIDIYPISTTNDPGQIVQVAAAQQALRSLAGGKPTYQWIEAEQPTGDVGATLTRAEIEAEAWMAIVNGARGLGWWTYGTSPFSVSTAGRRALTALGVALDTFAPAIDAPIAPVTLANGGVDVFATRRNGALTVFAVNTNPASAVNEIFTLPDLGRRPVHVWNTGQTIAASSSTFADTLPPLGWRVYVVAPR